MQPTTTPLNILIIEDERFISELYNRALEKAGHKVTICSDGEDGLREAETDNYDVILLDIMVPTMTGFEIMKRLRADDAKPLRSKIIISTNLEQSEEDRENIERQADGYLVKAEMTPKELVAYLSQLKIS